MGDGFDVPLRTADAGCPFGQSPQAQRHHQTLRDPARRNAANKPGQFDALS
jgi:hypothetical protein